MGDEKTNAGASTGKPYTRDSSHGSPDDLPWAEIITNPTPGSKTSRDDRAPVFQRVTDARGLKRSSIVAAGPVASTEPVEADTLPPLHVLFLGAAIIVLLALSAAIQIDF